jgi:hypothetical protein
MLSDIDACIRMMSRRRLYVARAARQICEADDRRLATREEGVHFRAIAEVVQPALS